jgi:hypothetical protein
MIPSPVIRDWACKLIASEVDADSASTRIDGAILRVYEKLRRQLSEPVGVDAFQALASRALLLTKSQFPSLTAVNITTNGTLCGLGDLDVPLGTDANVEIGVILIAQMLRLFLNLLGEAATVRLIDDLPFQIEDTEDRGTIGLNTLTTDSNDLGPFEDISLEANQLRHLSERLQNIADIHDDVDELMIVAGNIRSIATLLDIFTIVRIKAAGLNDSAVIPSSKGYVN